MIEWLPDVCGQLHNEMVTVFWMMLLPLIVLLVVLELFKTSSGQPDAGKVLFRGLISILLLVSFKETINLIALLGDGITDRIDGLAKMTQILDTFGDNLNRDAPPLYKFRELFIFTLNFASYFLAYFGVFVVEALIHFSWSILYVCAPLMILCYVPEQTAGVCKNLYKGLLTVISWKILWSVLGVLLLKLAVQKTTANSDDIITTAIINLCIGLSIMLVPLFSKSLLGDGLSSFTAGIAAVPGIAAMGVGKNLLSMPVKKGASWTGSKMRNGMKSITGGDKNALSSSQSKGTQRNTYSKRKGLK